MPIITQPDSYTKLLIHSNHADDSTDITDSSASNHTISRTGAMVHSTDVTPKFGASSLFFSANPYMTLPASSDWDVGSGDFTVDFWWQPRGSLNRAWFVSGMQDHNFSIAYKHQSSNKIEIWASSNGTSWDILGDGASGNGQSAGGEIVTEVWQHIAVVRHGGTKWYIFHNGEKVGDFTTAATAIYSSEMDDGIRIGIHGNVAYHIDGYIDEFRWSKGIARWTDSFVPPNKPYSVIDDDFVTDVSGIQGGARDSSTKISSDLIILSDPEEEAADNVFSVSDKSGNRLLEVEPNGNINYGFGGGVLNGWVSLGTADLTGLSDNTWYQISEWNFNNYGMFLIHLTNYNLSSSHGYANHWYGLVACRSGAGSSYGVATSAKTLFAYAHTNNPPTMQVRFNLTASATYRLEIHMSYTGTNTIDDDLTVKVMKFGA